MIDQLRTLLGDAIALRDGEMPELLSEQLGGMFYIRKLRAVLATLDYELEQIALANKDPNQLLESRGWVAEILKRSDRKEWRKAEMQQDMRARLLEICDTPEQVLDMLWDSKSGLQPLNMDMRMTPLKELWRIDPDEYCTVTANRQKIDILKGPEG